MPAIETNGENGQPLSIPSSDMHRESVTTSKTSSSSSSTVIHHSSSMETSHVTRIVTSDGREELSKGSTASFARAHTSTGTDRPTVQIKERNLQQMAQTVSAPAMTVDQKTLIKVEGGNITHYASDSSSIPLAADPMIPIPLTYNVPTTVERQVFEMPTHAGQPAAAEMKTHQMQTGFQAEVKQEQFATSVIKEHEIPVMFEKPGGASDPIAAEHKIPESAQPEPQIHQQTTQQQSHSTVKQESQSTNKFSIQTQKESMTVKQQKSMVMGQGATSPYAQPTLSGAGSGLAKEIEPKVPEQIMQVMPASLPKKKSEIKRKSTPARFITPLQGLLVRENDRVMFECAIDGYPEPSVSWTHNGEGISTDTQVSMSKNRISLLIPQARQSHSGRYTCAINNDGGSAQSTCDLVVKKTQFPPVFGKRLQPMVVGDGERLHLEVDVTGTPHPDIVWTRDNGQLLPTDGVEFFSDGTRHYLVIQRATLGDSGRYGVIASNPAGRAECLADVMVTQLIVDNQPAPRMMTFTDTCDNARMETNMMDQSHVKSIKRSIEEVNLGSTKVSTKTSKPLPLPLNPLQFVEPVKSPLSSSPGPGFLLSPDGEETFRKTPGKLRYSWPPQPSDDESDYIRPEPTSDVTKNKVSSIISSFSAVGDSAIFNEAAERKTFKSPNTIMSPVSAQESFVNTPEIAHESEYAELHTKTEYQPLYGQTVVPNECQAIEESRSQLEQYEQSEVTDQCPSMEENMSQYEQYEQYGHSEADGNSQSIDQCPAMEENQLQYEQYEHSEAGSESQAIEDSEMDKEVSKTTSSIVPEGTPVIHINPKLLMEPPVYKGLSPIPEERDKTCTPESQVNEGVSPVSSQKAATPSSDTTHDYCPEETSSMTSSENLTQQSIELSQMNYEEEHGTNLSYISPCEGISLENVELLSHNFVEQFSPNIQDDEPEPMLMETATDSNTSEITFSEPEAMIIDEPEDIKEGEPNNEPQHMILEETVEPIASEDLQTEPCLHGSTKQESEFNESYDVSHENIVQTNAVNSYLVSSSVEERKVYYDDVQQEEDQSPEYVEHFTRVVSDNAIQNDGMSTDQNVTDANQRQIDVCNSNTQEENSDLIISQPNEFVSEDLNVLNNESTNMHNISTNEDGYLSCSMDSDRDDTTTYPESMQSTTNKQDGTEPATERNTSGMESSSDYEDANMTHSINNTASFSQEDSNNYSSNESSSDSMMFEVGPVASQIMSISGSASENVQKFGSVQENKPTFGNFTCNENNAQFNTNNSNSFQKQESSFESTAKTYQSSSRVENKVFELNSSLQQSSCDNVKPRTPTSPIMPFNYGIKVPTPLIAARQHETSLQESRIKSTSSFSKSESSIKTTSIQERKFGQNNMQPLHVDTGAIKLKDDFTKPPRHPDDYLKELKPMKRKRESVKELAMKLCDTIIPKSPDEVPGGVRMFPPSPTSETPSRVPSRQGSESRKSSLEEPNTSETKKKDEFRLSPPKFTKINDPTAIERKTSTTNSNLGITITPFTPVFQGSDIIAGQFLMNEDIKLSECSQTVTKMANIEANYQVTAPSNIIPQKVTTLPSVGSNLIEQPKLEKPKPSVLPPSFYEPPPSFEGMRPDIIIPKEEPVQEIKETIIAPKKTPKLVEKFFAATGKSEEEIEVPVIKPTPTKPKEIRISPPKFISASKEKEGKLFSQSTVYRGPQMSTLDKVDTVPIKQESLATITKQTISNETIESSSQVPVGPIKTRVVLTPLNVPVQIDTATDEVSTRENFQDELSKQSVQDKRTMYNNITKVDQTNTNISKVDHSFQSVPSMEVKEEPLKKIVAGPDILEDVLSKQSVKDKCAFYNNILQQEQVIIPEEINELSLHQDEHLLQSNVYENVLTPSEEPVYSSTFGNQIENTTLTSDASILYENDMLQNTTQLCENELEENNISPDIFFTAEQQKVHEPETVPYKVNDGSSIYEVPVSYNEESTFSSAQNTIQSDTNQVVYTDENEPFKYETHQTTMDQSENMQVSQEMTNIQNPNMYSSEVVSYSQVIRKPSQSQYPTINQTNVQNVSQNCESNFVSMSSNQAYDENQSSFVQTISDEIPSQAETKTSSFNVSTQKENKTTFLQESSNLVPSDQPSIVNKFNIFNAKNVLSNEKEADTKMIDPSISSTVATENKSCFPDTASPLKPPIHHIEVAQPSFKVSNVFNEIKPKANAHTFASSNANISSSISSKTSGVEVNKKETTSRNIDLSNLSTTPVSLSLPDLSDFLSSTKNKITSKVNSIAKSVTSSTKEKTVSSSNLTTLKSSTAKFEEKESKLNIVTGNLTRGKVSTEKFEEKVSKQSVFPSNLATTKISTAKFEEKDSKSNVFTNNLTTGKVSTAKFEENVSKQNVFPSNLATTKISTNKFEEKVSKPNVCKENPTNYKFKVKEENAEAKPFKVTKASESIITSNERSQTSNIRAGRPHSIATDSIRIPPSVENTVLASKLSENTNNRRGLKFTGDGSWIKVKLDEVDPSGKIETSEQPMYTQEPNFNIQPQETKLVNKSNLVSQQSSTFETKLQNVSRSTIKSPTPMPMPDPLSRTVSVTSPTFALGNMAPSLRCTISPGKNVRKPTSITRASSQPPISIGKYKPMPTNLEPFPFEIHQPKPRKKSDAPAPQMPTKFQPSLFAESDYRSDLDGAKPSSGVWQNFRNDSEIMYKNMNLQMQRGRSMQPKYPSPPPPSQFDSGPLQWSDVDSDIFSRESSPIRPTRASSISAPALNIIKAVSNAAAQKMPQRTSVFQHLNNSQLSKEADKPAAPNYTPLRTNWPSQTPRAQAEAAPIEAPHFSRSRTLSPSRGTIDACIKGVNTKIKVPEKPFTAHDLSKNPMLRLPSALGGRNKPQRPISFPANYDSH